MSRIVQHFACASLALALLSGNALAAGNEIRMRVEKSAVAPAVGELSASPDAKADAEATGAKKTPPEPKKAEAKKTEPKQDAAAKAPASKPEKAKASPEAPPAHAPEAQRTEAAPKKVAEPKKSASPAAATAKKAAAKAHPAPDASNATSAPAPQGEAAQTVKAAAPSGTKAIPAAKTAPKPKPAPVVDPKAFLMPQGPSNPSAPVALPADASKGQFVGDVTVDFQPDRVTLHAATNAPASQVTHFTLSNPRKLAIDLHGTWRKKGGSVVRYDTGPIKVIVVGEHPDRLRLALEFREGAVPTELTPTVENGPAGLTVTIPLAAH